MSNEIQNIEDKIAAAVTRTVLDPNVPASYGAAKPISDAVSDEVAGIVMNSANLEPWYQSNVTLGALLIIITRMLAHFGYAIPADLHGPILDVVIAFGPYIGAAWVVLGRWVYSLPFGDGPIMSRLLLRRK